MTATVRPTRTAGTILQCCFTAACQVTADALELAHLFPHSGFDLTRVRNALETKL